MFTVYKSVEETQSFYKTARANMKVRLELHGGDKREFEVACASKGVLVLRDIDYAYNIVASEDLTQFDSLLHSNPFAVERVVITSNNKEYDLTKDGNDEIVYKVTSPVQVKRNVEIKKGEVLTLSVDEGVNWYDVEVVDVTDNQVLVKMEQTQDTFKYVVFTEDTETRVDNVSFELVDLTYRKKEV